MYSLTKLISDLTGVSTKENGAVSFLFAVLGVLFANLFGGWSPSLSVLVWLVIGDYATGLVASVYEGSKLSSKKGYIGIAKKVMIFFLVIVGYKLDVALGIKIIMSVIEYFYITNELISLIENLGRMGVPVPKQLVDIVVAIKGRDIHEGAETHEKSTH